MPDPLLIDKKKGLKILAARVLPLVAFVVITILLLPWFISLKDASVRQAFLEKITSMGVVGILIMFAIQVLQIVIAILPGEAVELLAGAAYGTLGGLALCLAGILTGGTLVFYFVRSKGTAVVEWLFSKEKIRSLSFLNNTKKLEILLFILFFIPGTPKDLLTYAAPLTKIRAGHFFFITTIARIPSVITSTYTGSALKDGHWHKAVLMFILMGALGVAGMLLYSHFTAKKKASEDTTGYKKPDLPV